MTLPRWKKNLIQGYQSFRASSYREQKDLYTKLGETGQNPEIMIIACSDSRADPSDIFNTFPGEVFVLRNVANIVPPHQKDTSYHGTSSAIEFAVKNLKVKAIVVMGHADCGGVKAYLDGGSNDDPDSFIGNWIKILDAAKNRMKKQSRQHESEHNALIFASVMQSLDHLITFPFVKRAVDDGELSLLGAYFSISQGKLMFADADGNFEIVPAEAD